MSKPNDLIGRNFGRLSVIGREENNKNGHSRWLCLCDCGANIIAFGTNLKRGRVQSCGCYRTEQSGIALVKHGMSSSNIYAVWSSMHARCKNINNKSYYRYGGRGISVCERWESFDNFYEDMGLPSEKQTLDRVDNSKGYSKENCRWATYKEQNNNRRTNRFIYINGHVKTISQWAEIFKIPQYKFSRMIKMGI